MSLAEEAILWLKTRADEAKRSGIVFGLSGGLDSAVVALLGRRAFGDNILGLIMPCHSAPQDEEMARLLANRCHIPVERVDLTPTFDTLLRTLGRGTRMAEANLKPRLRMVTLYYHAVGLGYLVAGTGNKSELTTGYFTKYGDGGADILPIGGLLKCEVRALARELGVPDEIIARPPTAGLWAGQTDEGDLGMTYDELDRAILALECGDTSACRPDVVTRVCELQRTSAHKRAMPPAFEPAR